MSNSFASLKKNRGSQFEKLNSKLQEMNKGNSNDDDRFWKLTVDESDVGSATIRFLPAPEGEDMPFVRMWDHGFQGPGGWYIENSLTTLGKDDPVSEYNSKLWNSGQQDEARKQKRRLNHFANIYVVKDPKHPENEGKVFLFKFGKVIFDMLNDAMFPQYDDIDAVNPFDLWEGAEFKLRSRKVDGWRKYDKSEFGTPGPVSKPDGTKMSDEELEDIWKQEYSLQELVDPKNFKSYDELQARLHKVLGLDGGEHAPTGSAEDDDQEMSFTQEHKEREATRPASKPSPSKDLDDDDDFFASLGADDDDEIPF